MMHRAIIGVIALAPLFLLSCVTSAPGPTTDAAAKGTVDCTVPDTMPLDHVQLRRATVEGDSLHLKVTYGGGCRPHDFVLYGCEPLSTSPARVNLSLSHNANEDRCRALITETRGFSLGPIRDRWRVRTGQLHGDLELRIIGPPSPEESSLTLRYAF